MKKLSLLAPLAVSFALFATACGSNNSAPDAGGATPPAANPAATTQNPGAPGAPAAPGTPGAPGMPGHSGVAGCNTNPGCSASNGGGSCAIGAQTCVDYTGSNEQARAQFQASCEHNNHGQNHSVYSTNACSTANLAGSCKTEGGTGNEAVVRFYAVGHMNTGTVQRACTEQTVCSVFCAP